MLDDHANGRVVWQYAGRTQRQGCASQVVALNLDGCRNPSVGAEIGIVVFEVDAAAIADVADGRVDIERRRKVDVVRVQRLVKVEANLKRRGTEQSERDTLERRGCCYCQPRARWAAGLGIAEQLRWLGAITRRELERHRLRQGAPRRVAKNRVVIGCASDQLHQIRAAGLEATIRVCVVAGESRHELQSAARGGVAGTGAN